MVQPYATQRTRPSLGGGPPSEQRTNGVRPSEGRAAWPVRRFAQPCLPSPDSPSPTRRTRPARTPQPGSGQPGLRQRVLRRPGSDGTASSGSSATSTATSASRAGCVVPGPTVRGDRPLHGESIATLHPRRHAVLGGERRTPRPMASGTGMPGSPTTSAEFGPPVNPPAARSRHWPERALPPPAARLRADSAPVGPPPPQDGRPGHRRRNLPHRHHGVPGHPHHPLRRVCTSTRSDPSSASFADRIGEQRPCRPPGQPVSQRDAAAPPVCEAGPPPPGCAHPVILPDRAGSGDEESAPQRADHIR